MEDKILIKLGEKIAFYRKQMGLKQGDLAVFVDCQRENISAIECGKKDIRFSTLYKIVGILQIDTNELFSNKSIELADSISDRKK